MDRLHYTITGNGPVILMLPGMGLDMHIFDALAMLLQRRFMCVQIDNLGSGASPAPRGPYTIEQMADQVKQILLFEEIDSAAVVGHSMSGFVAMSLARQAPERVHTLVLMGSAPSGQWVIEHRDPDVARVLKDHQGHPEDVVARNLEMSVAEDFFENRREEFALLLEERLHHIGPGRGFAGQKEAAAAFSIEALPELPECPIHIIHGKADRLIPPSAATALLSILPHASLHLLDGIGHLPMVEAPATVASLLTQLLPTAE